MKPPIPETGDDGAKVMLSVVSFTPTIGPRAVVQLPLPQNPNRIPPGHASRRHYPPESHRPSLRAAKSPRLHATLNPESCKIAKNRNYVSREAISSQPIWWP